ncbi:MAG: hypothetical protein AB1558_12425, partial [Thermodesulfobacteriota bacterium]
MDYRSHRTTKARTKPGSAKRRVALFIALLLTGAALTAGLFYREDVDGFYSGLLRIRNTVS